MERADTEGPRSWPNLLSILQVLFNHGSAPSVLQDKDNETLASGGTSGQAGMSSKRIQHENPKMTTMTMNNEVNAMPVIPPTMVNEQVTIERPKQNLVNLVVEKVLKRNPGLIRKYVRGETRVLTLCYLAGMVLNARDYKVDPHMVDKVLLDKLQNVKVVQTKVSVQQNGILNRGS